MSERLELLLARMPAQFTRDPNSNHYKLLQLIANSSEDTRVLYDTMLKFWDVDQAEGNALDRLGKDEGIAREGMDDDEYRKMIKIQFILNQSDGDIPTMNLILDAYFGENFIGLEEGWKAFDAPATLIANLEKITMNIPFRLIRRLKPAGVGMILGTKQKSENDLIIGGMCAVYMQTTIQQVAIEVPNLDMALEFGGAYAAYQRTTITQGKG